MESNNRKLYDNIIQSKRATVDEIGDFDTFNNLLQDSTNAVKLYNNLVKNNRFKVDEIGTQDQFMKLIDPLPKQPEVAPFEQFNGRGAASDTVRPVIQPEAIKYKDQNQPKEGEFNPVDFGNQDPMTQLGKGWKAGVQNLKGGLKYLGGVVGETLDNLDGEDEMQWDNRLMESARKNFAAAPKGEGIWYELGSFAPQMVGIAAASAAAPITGGTSLAAVPAVIGGANIAMLVGSSAGMAMNQYDEYVGEKGREGNDLARIGVGIASGAAEYLAERIGLDRYMPKGSMAKAFTKFLSKNTDVAEDIAKKAATKNPNLIKGFASKTVKNALEEGSEEAITEAGNILIETLYKDKEDYSSFEEIVDRMGSAFRGGAMMGGVMTPITYTADQLYQRKMAGQDPNEKTRRELDRFLKDKIFGLKQNIKYGKENNQEWVPEAEAELDLIQKDPLSYFQKQLADSQSVLDVDPDSDYHQLRYDSAKRFIDFLSPEAAPVTPTPPPPDGVSPSGAVMGDQPKVPTIDPRDTARANAEQKFNDIQHESGNAIFVNVEGMGSVPVKIGNIENGKIIEPDGSLFVIGPDGNAVAITADQINGQPIVVPKDQFINDALVNFDAEAGRRDLANKAAIDIEGRKYVDTGVKDEQGNLVVVPLDENSNPIEAEAMPITPEQFEQAQQAKNVQQEAKTQGQPAPAVEKATWGKTEYQYKVNEDGSADVMIPNSVKPEAALKEIQKHFEKNTKFEAVPVTETREVPPADRFSDPTTENIMTGIKIVPKQIATPAPIQDNKKAEKQAEPKYLFGKETITKEETAEMINLAETPQELEGLRIDNDPELQQMLLQKFPDKAPKYTVGGQPAAETTVKAMIRMGKNLDQIQIENNPELKTLYDKKVKELTKTANIPEQKDKKVPEITPEQWVPLNKKTGKGTENISLVGTAYKDGMRMAVEAVAPAPEGYETGDYKLITEQMTPLVMVDGVLKQQPKVVVTSFKDEAEANRYLTDLQEGKLPKSETTPVGQSQDLETKKAEIERRRQEELGKVEKRSYKNDEGDTVEVIIKEDATRKVVVTRKYDENGDILGQFESVYPKELPNDDIYKVHNGNEYEYSDTEQIEVRGKLADRINAKYDAELANINKSGKDPKKDNTEESPEQIKKREKDVSFIFRKSPQLKEIGTESEYAEYLGTIFPNSLYKNVVWHGSESKDLKGFNSRSKRFGREGVYFFPSVENTMIYSIGRTVDKINKARVERGQTPLNQYEIRDITRRIQDASKMGSVGNIDDIEVNYDKYGQTYGAIINVQNIEKAKSYNEISHIDPNKAKQLKDKGVDTVSNFDLLDEKERTNPFEEIAVLDPANIHLLGSQNDIKLFQDFVSRKRQAALEQQQPTPEQWVPMSKKTGKGTENISLVGTAYKDGMRMAVEAVAPAPEGYESGDYKLITEQMTPLVMVDGVLKQQPKVVVTSFKDEAEANRYLNDLQEGDLPKSETIPTGQSQNLETSIKPTKENVTERLSIQHPFYKKVNKALVDLGLIKEGTQIGGYVQPLSKDGGFASGDMYFKPDGSISYVVADGTVQFDKDGNVVSENVQEIKSKKLKTNIEVLKTNIYSLEEQRDSDNFRYKTVTETDIVGNKRNVSRLKTTEELKQSTEKINSVIEKNKNELASLEQQQAGTEQQQPTPEQELQKKVTDSKKRFNDRLKAIQNELNTGLATETKWNRNKSINTFVKEVLNNPNASIEDKELVQKYAKTINEITKAQNKQIKAMQGVKLTGRKPRSLSEIQQRAVDIDVYDPIDIAKQYFIQGGKINKAALEYIFGDKSGKRTGKTDPAVEAERKRRIGYYASEGKGKGVDEISHELWEMYGDLVPDSKSEDFREAVIKVIMGFNSTTKMAENIVNNYSQQAPEDIQDDTELDMQDDIQGDIEDSELAEIAETVVDNEPVDVPVMKQIDRFLAENNLDSGWFTEEDLLTTIEDNKDLLTENDYLTFKNYLNGIIQQEVTDPFGGQPSDTGLYGEMEADEDQLDQGEDQEAEGTGEGLGRQPTAEITQPEQPGITSELDNFDFNQLFDTATESNDVIPDNEKQRRFESAGFDPKWAKNYDEAVEKLIRQYRDAKATKDDWETRQYKKNDNKVEFGKDEFDSGEISISQANENRRQQRIRAAEEEMNQSISDLGLLMSKSELNALLSNQPPAPPQTTPTAEQAPGISLEQLVAQVETEAQRKEAERNKQLEGLNSQQRKDAQQNIARIESGLESKKNALTEAINAVQQAKDHFEKERTKQGSLFAEQEPSKPFFYQGVAIDTPKDFSPENINRIIKPLVKLVETRQRELIEAQDKLQPQIEQAIKTAKAQGDLWATPLDQKIDEANQNAPVRREEKKVNQDPSDAQKEAGNYQKGHIKAQGFDITIENPKGSTRSGTDQSGKKWEQTMNNTYGYFKRTKGKDGDQVDVFLGSTPETGKIFVVDQFVGGKFDEHKVMMGFNSEQEAKESYLSNYEEGWEGLGAITEVSRDDFKEWLKDGTRTKKPFNQDRLAGNTDIPQPSAKQPWEMTREEYEDFDTRGFSYAIVKDENVVSSGSNPKLGKDQMPIKSWVDYANRVDGQLYIAPTDNQPLQDMNTEGLIMGMTWEQLNSMQQGKRIPTPPLSKMPVGAILYPTHSSVIQQALAEGKTVPSEVLKDYPELKPAATIPDFKSYQEAQDWIEQRQKDYPSKNAFLASDEYKRAYPKIEKLANVEKQRVEQQAQKKLEDAGLKVGDRVTYTHVSPLMTAEKYSGTIVFRDGLPYVKFDPGQVTQDGRKSIQWHEGFKKEATTPLENKLNEIVEGRKPDPNRKTIVLDEGNGKVINDLWNEFNAIKNKEEQDAWNEKVKATKFGTYGTISIFETLRNFEPKYPNEILQKDFITGLEIALDVPKNERTYKVKEMSLKPLWREDIDDYIDDQIKVVSNNGKENNFDVQFLENIKSELSNDKGKALAQIQSNIDKSPESTWTDHLLKIRDIINEGNKPTKEYRYHLTIRPFGIGTYPDADFVKWEDDGTRFGTLVYSKPVPAREQSHFSLSPITEAEALDGKTVDVDGYEWKLKLKKNARGYNYFEAVQYDQGEEVDRMNLSSEEVIRNIEEGSYIVKPDQPGSQPANQPDKAGKMDALKATTRFKPAKAIIFENPVTGPSGAKLTGYEWKYEWVEEWSESKGETVERRRSDWDNAEQSAETGKNIVHQFTVVMPNGEAKTVSAESVLSLLGYADKTQMQSFPTLVNAVKTLAKQEMQLSILNDKLKFANEAEEKVDAMKLPEIKMGEKTDRRVNWIMGDAEVVGWNVENFEGKLPSEVISQERKEALIDSWKRNRLRELGVTKESEKSRSIKREIKELEKRIDKQKEKVQKITQSAPEAVNTPLEQKLEDLFKGKQAEPKDIQLKNTTTPETPIEDFGEKILGAKKDIYSKINNQLEATQDDVLTQGFAKVFPLLDYAKMVEAGAVTPEEAALLHYMREKIGVKPQKKYKINTWISNIESYKNVLRWLTNKEDFKAKHDGKDFMELMDKSLSVYAVREIKDYIKLLTGVGFPENNVRLGDFKIMTSLAGEMSTARKDENGRVVKDENGYVIYDKNTKPVYSITKLSNIVKTFDSYEQAVEALKYILTSTKEAPNQTKFDIYYNRNNPDNIIIGKKVGKNYIALVEGFKNSREAQQYVKENQEGLEKLLEEKKTIPYERPESSREREGLDRRKGKDATPQMFAEAFQFRGVQFGNWVEQGKRQEDLNRAYDALMDLADIIGVPPAALSLNGELGLAFGARGSGGKQSPAAHYEPTEIVINLTKKAGAGSLAHEWFHAVDNYLSRMRGMKNNFLTETPYSLINKDGTKDQRVRNEVIEAIKEITTVIRKSGLAKRSKDLDTRRTKDYWSQMLEMSARSFESYVLSKLQEKGISNDYLVSFLDIATYSALQGGDSYPYPTFDEAKVINPAFEKLFNTLQTKEEDGRTILYEKSAEYRTFTENNVVQDAAIQTQINWQEPVSAKRTEAFGSDTETSDLQRERNYDPRIDNVLTFTERQLSDRGYLTFMGEKLTGTTKIKSANDVAFLFKNLESAASENAFAVHVDEKGRYKVQYLGTGGTTGVIVDIKQVVGAAKEFGSKKVWFVHNHPSGNLEASDADYRVSKMLKDALFTIGVKFEPPVIINLDSGYYATVDVDFKYTQKELSVPSWGKVRNVKVHQFDRIVLHRNTAERNKIGGSEDVARFLSKQKRGSTNKIHVLILDRNNNINRYYLFDESVSTEELVNQLASDVSKYGESVILATNGLINPQDAFIIRSRLKKMDSNLLDVLTIKQDEDIVSNYKSMADAGQLNEPSVQYANESAPRYRKVSPIGYYSTVEDALGRISQEKGTPDQYKAMLLKNGAKQAELDWMGWDELAGKSDRLTKAQVQEWINQNRIEVKEVVKSADQFPVTADDVDSVVQNEDGEWVVTFKEEAFGESVQPDAATATEAINNAIEELRDSGMLDEGQPEDRTKYSGYQLPGGSSYQEKLLTMPMSKTPMSYEEYLDVADMEGGGREGYNEYLEEFNRGRENAGSGTFQSPHWDEPNVLAHVRHKDYTDTEGRKILLLEEIQSDWAQKGKKEGFGKKNNYEIRKDGDFWQVYDARGDKYGLPQKTERAAKIIAEGLSASMESSIIPDMPFKKTDQWVNLALRRMMRYAAENGYDGIAWTPGSIQNKRYSLSKQVDVVEVTNMGEGIGYNIYARGQGTDLIKTATAKELPDILGKELADKIIKSNIPYLKTKIYSGLDLEVGGDGMKGFYDQIIPAQAGKLAKPFNSKVQTTTLNLNEGVNLDSNVEGIPSDGMLDVQFIPVTAEMIASVSQGVPFFQQILNNTGIHRTDSKADIRKKLNELQSKARNARKMYIYETAEDLDRILRRAKMSDYHRERAVDTANKKDSAAFYMTDSKSVFIDLSQIKNTDEAVSVWIHEMGIHAGVRNIIPENKFEETMEAVYNFVEAELQNENENTELKDNERYYRALFEQSTTGIYEKLDKWEKGEEMLAYMAEKLNREGRLKEVDRPFWDKVVEIIMDMLRKVFSGNKILLTKQDIINIAKASIYSNYAQGDMISDMIDRGDLNKNQPEGILRPDGKTVYSLNKSPFLDERLSSGSYMPDKLTIDGVERSTRNSNGQPIHPTRRGIENFWKWFGDSKVVDEQGRPLVVYHGTKADFTTFRPNNGQIMFTPSLDYANILSGGAKVMPVYLRITNPIMDADLDLFEFSRGYVDYIEEVKKEGYDGAWSNDNEQISVFSAEQIKSATGNEGGFDPDDPNIRSRKAGKLPLDDIVDSAGEDYAYTKAARRAWPEIKDGMREFFKEVDLPIRRLQERIKKLGGKVTDNSNPYRDINLGKGRLEELFREFTEEKMKPVLQTVTKIVKSGINGDNILPYMISKHALERNPDLRAKEYEDEVKKFTFRNQNLEDEAFQEALGKFETKLTERLQDKDYSGVMEFQRLHVARGGQEYTNPEELAAAIVDSFESKVDAKLLGELWSNMKIASTTTLNTWKAGNQLTEDEYQYQLSRYKYFVPLRGWREAAEKELAYLSGIGTGSKSLRYAQGRKTMAENPLAVMQNVAFKALTEQVDNEVRQAMMNLVVNNYDKPEFKAMYEIKTAYYVKAILEDGTEGWTLSRDADGNLVKPDPEKFESGEATIKTYRDHEKRRTKVQAKEHELIVRGKNMDHVIVFKNKELNIAQAMNHQNLMYRVLFTGEKKNIEDWNKSLVNTLGSLNNWLKAMYTSFNIVFPLTNFSRDAQEASLTQWIKGESGVAVIKNYKKAFPAIVRDIYGKQNNSNTDKLLKRFYQAGGATGYTHSKTPEQIEKELNRQMQDMMDTGKLKGSLGRGVRKVIHNVELWNRLFEDSTRFSVFMSAVERGYSDKEAASQAKEASVNFNRKGKSSKAFDAYWAFWNVALESMFKNFGLAKNYPKRFATVAGGFVTAGFIMTMLNDLYSDDDDDEDYYNISEFARYNYLLIPDIFTKIIKGEQGNKYLRIPLPQFWRGFFATGSLLYDTAIKGKVDPGKATMKSLIYFAEGLSPVDIPGIYVDGKFSAAPLVPTVYRPFQEANENRNFLGERIYREPFTLAQQEALADSGLGKENVNIAAKFVTDMLFRLGGGEPDTGLKGRIVDGEAKRVSEFFDFNPSYLEHIVKGFTGGTGGVVTDAITTLGQVALPDQKVDFRNMPFVNAFVRKIPEGKWNTVRKYYDVRDKLRDYEQIQKEYMNIARETGDQRAINRAMDSYNNKYALEYIRTVDNYDKRLDKLMKTISLKDAENSDMILNIMEMAVNSVDDLNKKYNKK